MSIIERTVIFIDSINDWVGRAISWLLVVMVLNVFLVVVLRYVFGFGAIWMQELYVWSHAIVFLLGAGYTLLHKGHVRIDLIYRSASKKYKSLIDLLGSIFFALPVIYFIFIKSLPMVERSWKVLKNQLKPEGYQDCFCLKLFYWFFPYCLEFNLFH